jgi:hypothetical protein
MLLVYWLHFVDKITTMLGCCYNRDVVIIQSFVEYSEINSPTWKDLNLAISMSSASERQFSSC